eukprot:CAMPEP_0185026864 /NCGR_PEP_ID=MMETSP1103-20130426/11414_1 /TAXON_ID=36769 /ORGANISM="Paraphysomonas bandaiensis, Strain Caron Lab Isolate" /LENGTH=142 /DNA_ID=CAMNT_0027560595 /DNA_START=59 /DNA_END=487 /DNA_ORIENTATION=-
MDNEVQVVEDNVNQSPLTVYTKMDCSKVYVKQSPLGGDGAFAAVALKAGELVEFGMARRLTNVNGHENPYIFTWSEDRTVWAFCSGAATYYNTSKDPNCRFVRHFDEDRFEVFALRDIAKDEELTHTYKSIGWRECFLKLNE